MGKEIDLSLGIAVRAVQDLLVSSMGMHVSHTNRDQNLTEEDKAPKKPLTLTLKAKAPQLLTSATSTYFKRLKFISKLVESL